MRPVQRLTCTSGGPARTIIVVGARQSPGTRAKDTDRNKTCEILDSALAEGQLSMAEHRHRVAVATKATTLGELQDLVTDLQIANKPMPTPGKPRGGSWWLKAAAAGVAVAAVIATAWTVFGGTNSPPEDPGAKPPEPAVEIPVAPTTAEKPGAIPDDVAPTVLSVPKELHTPDGMTGLLEQMRKRFGDTTGIELAITSDEAMLFRPDPTDDQSKLLYRFRGGWGDPTTRPRDDKDLPADLGAFDVRAVAEVLRAAPQTLGIDPADVSEIIVDVDHIQVPAGPGALELLVKLSKRSGGDGYIYLDSAGNTKRVEYPA